MTAYKECRFYLEGNHCSHRDAPQPRISSCLGKEHCEAWEDSILNQARNESEIVQQARQDTAREIFEELEVNCSYTGEAGHPIINLDSDFYQSFKSKYLIPPNPVGNAEL